VAEAVVIAKLETLKTPCWIIFNIYLKVGREWGESERLSKILIRFQTLEPQNISK
jgi:hypothetical protein